MVGTARAGMGGRQKCWGWRRHRHSASQGRRRQGAKQGGEQRWEGGRGEDGRRPVFLMVKKALMEPPSATARAFITHASIACCCSAEPHIQPAPLICPC